MTANSQVQKRCDRLTVQPKAEMAALERKVADLRHRLQVAERHVVSESVAHQDQAKLARTMARAARAEAREREELARANAELAALVRSMEEELVRLKAEHAVEPDPAAGQSENADDEPASGLKRTGTWPLRVAVGVLWLGTAMAGAVLYPYVFGSQAGGDGRILGQATVIDGGTMRIDGKTVRLLGIDPMPAETEEGARAKRYLQQLTAGQEVRCEPGGRAAGGGILAQCFIGAVDIGQIMTLSGNVAAKRVTQTGRRPG